MAESRRETRADERCNQEPRRILDLDQPLVQAGFTVWLLDAHLAQRRERAERGHHWLCPCVRQN